MGETYVQYVQYVYTILNAVPGGGIITVWFCSSVCSWLVGVYIFMMDV